MSTPILADNTTFTHPAAGLVYQGQLRLLFIGTGSAFTKKFYQINLFVDKGTDHVLIDCGTRTSEALSRLSLSVPTFKNYLVTHSHSTWRPSEPSYGLLIHDRVLFSGDTRFDPGLLVYLENRYELKAIFHD